jgi:hypothetical protein
MRHPSTRFGASLVMAALLAAAAPAPGTPAPVTPAPIKLGQCVRAKIASLGQRLMDARTDKPLRGSGSVVRFSNLLEQVSYDEIPAIRRSRVGDPVEMCLIQLPSDCPPGDARGKVYRTTNLRTRSSWTLSDSEHSCGGA